MCSINRIIVVMIKYGLNECNGPVRRREGVRPAGELPFGGEREGDKWGERARNV